MAEHWTDARGRIAFFRTRAEEGDLVRLLSRTGEALLQIARLGNSNPQAAGLAPDGRNNPAPADSLKRFTNL